MNWRNIFKTAAAVMVVSTSAYANNQTEMIDMTKPLIQKSWEVRELSTRLAESKELRNSYLEEFSTFVKNSRETAKTIVEEDRIEEFSTFYKSLDDMGKQSLEFVVKAIIELGFENRKAGEEQIRAQDYFPGYGYGKPGYTYRKGQEVDREHLYAYWKDEEIEEETSSEKELTMEISLAMKFKIELGEAVQELGKFDIDIDGKIVEVMKMKVTKSVKIKTKQKRKFSYEKAWFELWEAKKKWFGDLDWKLAGKTFQFDRFPTGEDVIVEASVVEN
jgi:hypothetical protein